MLQLPTDPGLPRAAHADTRVQVESDPVALRRELEAARQALRTQTLRCRQMDVALSRRLEQKEVEVQNWKTLREQQLSQIMRALMMLEARLRREQRTIRSQLGERDAVIRAQQLEISRLKKLLDCEVRQEEVKPTVKTPELSTPSIEFEYDCDVKPDLISSLGISHLRRNPDKSLTPTTTDNEDSQSNLDSLQFSFYEVGSQPESLMSNLSTQSCNGDVSEGAESSKESAEYTRVSPPKPPQDHHWNEPNSARTTNNNNYFLDLKTTRCQELANNLKKLEVKVHMETQYPQKNVLSPVKEESSMSLVSACTSPSRCTPCDEQTVKCLSISSDTQYQDCKPSPSTLLQEVRISGRNEYEDNPVLSCVNQILLRDQEEFLEEQRALRLKEQEKSKKEAEAKLNNKKLTKSTENLSLLSEQIIVQHSPVKNKVYSPLNSVSPNHVTEQLIKHPTQPDIEEDHYKSITKSSPKKRTSPKESPHVKSVPPALPPKPQRLLFSKSLDQKAIINSILPHMKGDESNALDIIKKRASLPNPSADSELYVISNSAIDDELLHQLQGRRIKSCSELPVSLNTSKPLNQSRESIYAPVLSHPNHKPPVKSPSSTTPQKDKSMEQKTPPKKPLPRDDEASRVIPKHSPTKKIMSSNNCIKVASPVSSLLNSVDVVEPPPGEETGAGGKKTSPSVSQIVRRFEDLGTKVGKDTSVERTDDNSNSLQKNFEEFRLDECDMDTLCGDGRPEGDGAEMRLNGTAAVLEARISYENFLEATGLSQKSIVTPSRLFSNHKSVMKPKDVKHRSRVKAAAVVDRCNNNTPAPGSSIVRYWTEPFL